MPEVTPGTILGHEAVGTVVEVGAAVTTVAAGRPRARVVHHARAAAAGSARKARYGQCIGGGGWIFGHLIDGLQAEYARVPFADTSVYKVPDGLTDEQVLFLADILPTAYEVGVLNGRVEPGDTVAIVGAGPIGLAAIMTAQLLHARPDRRDRPRRRRLAQAQASSAPTSTINNGARGRARARSWS